MQLRTLRSFQTNPHVSTASERPLPHPSGRSEAADPAPTQYQPNTSESEAQASTANVRPGLQQDAGFEATSLNFPKPQEGQAGQEPLTAPLSENQAEATGVGDVVQQGVERFKEGWKQLSDDCKAPSKYRRGKSGCPEIAKETSNPGKAPRFDQMRLNDFLRSSPSELRQVFQNTRYPPQIRTRAALAYSQQIGLLSAPAARNLFNHPYTQRLGTSSQSNAANNVTLKPA